MKNKNVFLGIFVSLFFTACSVVSVENNSSIKPMATLTNTYFKATVLNGSEVEIFNREPHIRFQDDGKVFGTLGCNNFFGTYKKDKNEIMFQGVASTKMMCHAIKTEDNFSKVLQNTKTYEIKEESLILFDKDKKEIAKFEAVYLK
ncbi:MAG: META domain-containing protein [Arcobacter sp.]|nr:META domain-containing protein [Arcobacter sp.]